MNLLVLLSCMGGVGPADSDSIDIVRDTAETSECSGGAYVGDVGVTFNVGDGYAVMTETEEDYVCSLSGCELPTVELVWWDELRSGSWSVPAAEAFEAGLQGGPMFMAFHDEPLDTPYAPTHYLAVWSDRRAVYFTDGDSRAMTSGTLRPASWFEQCVDASWYGKDSKVAYDCMQLNGWIGEECEDCVPDGCPT